MARRIAIALTGAAATSLAVAVIYVVGVRMGTSRVRDAARVFHRALGNPIQMRRAGRRRAFASVLEHRGRTTGRTYETPVWAVPTEDGFAIAIVYGARTDWLKNVLMTGTAVIVHGGERFAVDQPEIVSIADARTYFPATLQQIHLRMGIDRCLRLRRVEPGVRVPAAASSASSHDDGRRER